MMYNSTRNSEERVSAAEAISRGISSDGGLFVPESLPVMGLSEISALTDKSYTGRAEEILSLFLTDFTREELRDCISEAYGTKFRNPNIAPLSCLYDGVYMLELWHGPTCAFKDMALQILPGLMRVSAGKTTEGKNLVILVATSGDTGKAALEGFRDAENTKILVFYPEDGVSPMQKLQMTTQEGKNVSVCAIRGNFDDAQNGVKEIFTDADMLRRMEKNGMMFSSANSINWGRLVPQIVYYFSAYADLIKRSMISIGDKINIAVPTGNFGNILAAYYAMRMGLPVSRLICASNRNNVLSDFINTGVYDRNRAFFTTDSPSMDILISSNLERLLYDLYDKNPNSISDIMDELKRTGRYEVPEEILSCLRGVFSAGWCDDAQTESVIREVYRKYGYLCDPHTAVGIGAYEQYREQTGDTTPVVIASTANPYKFTDSVLRALGAEQNIDDDFGKLEQIYRITGCEIPPPLANLRGKSERFKDTCDRADMQQAVCRYLGL